MDILEIILKNTYSLSQLKRRIRALKEYLSVKIYSTKDVSQYLPAGRQGLDEQDAKWIKSLPEDFLSRFSSDNISTIFSDIEAEIQKLPILTIFISIEATEEVSEQIGTFIRNNFSTFKLIETKYDPSLIAGCALSQNGVYRDYSLRASVEEKKMEILGNFKKFLR